MNCKITEQQTRQIMRLDGDVTDMNHLAGKVRLKNQQKSIYSKSCQDIIELCEIRDCLSSCDTLSNDDICKIIDIICIE